jgi:aspartate/methionine/tyrosine aminotransferase
MMPGSLVRELIEFAISRKVFLLFDETYDFYTYEDQVHHSLVSFADAENPYYAVVGSFSKTYAMTGWRLGYGIGAADLIKRVNAFQSHTTGNACTISQRAALSLLERGEPGRPELLRMFSERRQFAVSALSKIPGFLCPSPAGSFYVFPKVESCIKRCGLKNSTELSRFLLNEAHVATVPGDAFGTDGYLRISYATPMENLEEGIRRIQQALA